MSRGTGCQRCPISEDDIELHIMGRLEDESVRQHLNTCPVCKDRVERQREQIAVLKMALREWSRRRPQAVKYNH